MTREEILSHVDHTLLKPEATWPQIQVICDEAVGKSHRIHLHQHLLCETGRGVSGGPHPGVLRRRLPSGGYGHRVQGI